MSAETRPALGSPTKSSHYSCLTSAWNETTLPSAMALDLAPGSTGTPGRFPDRCPDFELSRARRLLPLILVPAQDPPVTSAQDFHLCCSNSLAPRSSPWPWFRQVGAAEPAP